MHAGGQRFDSVILHQKLEASGVKPRANGKNTDVICRGKSIGSSPTHRLDLAEVIYEVINSGVRKSSLTY